MYVLCFILAHAHLFTLNCRLILGKNTLLINKVYLIKVYLMGVNCPQSFKRALSINHFFKNK